jgi:hypothetical protein
VDLKVTFAERNLSEIEPLVVTGESQTGDFIFVRFLDSSTVQFGYDRWGVGGPVSAPMTIEPRRSYGLKLQSPSLASVRGSASSVPPRIRIEFEGRVVLEGDSQYDFRAGRHAWFGENPLVGSSCGPRFSGTLSWEGQVLRGSVRRTLTRSQVIAAWFKAGYWQVIGVALAGLMAGWLTARVARDRGVACRGWIRAHPLAPHRWFMITAAVCAAGFWWLVTAGTGRLLVPETFGSFYDYQAASLLQGRLDVPAPGISGEAFIVAGKHYGYFGILPALLRLPFVVYDVAFGEIIRSAMLGYFVGCLIAAYALLCWAARQREPTATPSALATVLFTLSVGLGSTLLFLGSRAYIYHEAILAGAMFALGSAVFALHWLEKPDSRAWIAALVSGILAVQTRPTPGLFALSLLGVTAIAVGLQTGRIRRTLLVGLLACLGILSFNAMSYLKFRTLDGSPFKYSVQYSAERRARFEDKNFHLVNIPRNFDTYVTRANFRLEKGFPWFYPTTESGPPIRSPSSISPR